jgi:hypothetical protein
VDKLDTELENLINLVDTWRRLLEDFRPVAQEAADAEEEERSLDVSGFLQV